MSVGCLVRVLYAYDHGIYATRIHLPEKDSPTRYVRNNINHNPWVRSILEHLSYDNGYNKSTIKNNQHES